MDEPIMGELYRPGRPPRPPVEPRQPPIPRPRPSTSIVLECVLCGRLFTDPLLALAHQEEHLGRGEKPCFRIHRAV